MKINTKTKVLLSFMIFSLIGLSCAADMTNQIESAIKNTYVYSEFLKNEKITVKATKKGEVTLTGDVSLWSHKYLAEETAKHTKNVTKVNNKLNVQEKEEDPKSDIWIGMKIKSLLLFHADVSGLKTEVTVSSGKVTLRGEAESNAGKDLATEYAKDVDGVKNVNNEMTLSNSQSALNKVGESIDDASITAQAKITLLFHKATSALKTDISTDKGTITVAGTAENEAERTLVSKLLSDNRGVKEVINEMTVNK